MNNCIIKSKGVVTSSGLIRDCFITIKDGIIKSIEKEPKIQGNERIADLSPYIISAPFCDYHLHFSKDRNVSETVHSLIKHGILNVFDGGDKDASAVDIKASLKESPVNIKLSAYAVYKNGGYGSYIGKGADSVKDACKLVDELLLLEDIAYVKIINSGIFIPQKQEVSKGGFTALEIKELINYCKSNGLEVFCHANGDEKIKDAVKAGASAIVHGFFISDDTISLMAQKETALIPTVNALASLGKIAKSVEAKAAVEQALNRHIEAIGKCYDKDVAILSGSDSGASFLPYGEAFLDELLMFQRAEMTFTDIISKASLDTLDINKDATFIVLDGLNLKKVFIKGSEYI
ncbi:amidohydrolase [Candidatus Magnetoovum chiemensis]|nr:amidohydrolase [Candidatus Magnetoovum chiemensis]